MQIKNRGDENEPDHQARGEEFKETAHFLFASRNAEKEFFGEMPGN